MIQQNTYIGISNSLENAYGDFYGLISSSSPSSSSVLNGELNEPMPMASQFAPGSSVSFDNADAEMSNNLENKSVFDNLSGNQKLTTSWNKTGTSVTENEQQIPPPQRSRRNRPASFSAASGTSYTTFKDMAKIEMSSENIGSQGPTQVGFATPQLGPTTFADDFDFGADTGLGDINGTNITGNGNGQGLELNIDSSTGISNEQGILNSADDPLFINPQLLDPCFDSNFFLSNSLASNNSENQTAKSSSHDGHDSKMLNHQNERSDQNNTSPSHASLLDLDTSDFSWLYPNPNNSENIDPRSTSPQNPNNKTPSLFNSTNNGKDIARNKIFSQMARGNLANTSNKHVSGSSPSNGNENNSFSFGDNKVPHDNNWNANSAPNSFDASAQNNFATLENQQFGNAEMFDFTNTNNGTDNLDKSSSFNHPHRITPELRLHIINILSIPTSFSTLQKHNLPSTEELQLYVDAYVANFGKHLPFLHHTLEFSQENVALALGMAAIGALYLFQRDQSAQIFEISRCCVHVYLESRRENKPNSNENQSNESKNEPDPFNTTATPLWLIQALLLGVIYGLFNEETLANEIAVAQANAVISLAKSASLHLPSNNPVPVQQSSSSFTLAQQQWHYFVQTQERIRTMHVVHIISCLLATGYNFTTNFKNSDIKCGSPCDEDLWSATDANSWLSILQQKENESKNTLSNNENKGRNNSNDGPGYLAVATQGPDFLQCLSKLMAGNTLTEEVSHFTLLSLVYAIHLDIHERRNEHDKYVLQKGISFGNNDNNETRMAVESSWLQQEKQRTEYVLRAWETTWSLSPHATLIPPQIQKPVNGDLNGANSSAGDGYGSGGGSLVSDSIPMSSLAHVRLYVDLRKVKEAFWKRDFDGMGRELSKVMPVSSFSDFANRAENVQGENGNENEANAKRSNALVEAASYAADTISLWQKQASKWTLQLTALETFVHTIVSLFDCGLIVSEFFHRLERRDEMTWTHDERLLVKRLTKIFFRVFDVLFTTQENGNNFQQQQFYQNNSMGNNNNNHPSSNVMMMMMQQQIPMSIIALTAVSRILSVIYVWPYAVVMAQALRARIMQIRVEDAQFNRQGMDSAMNGSIDNRIHNNSMNQQANNPMNFEGFGQINGSGMNLPNGFSTNQMENGNNHNSNNNNHNNNNDTSNFNNNENFNGNTPNQTNSNTDGNSFPLNVANMAAIMNQLGMGNLSNMSVSQFGEILARIKQMGMFNNMDNSPVSLLQSQQQQNQG